MICPNKDCRRNVSPFDTSCPNCGASLKGNPVSDYEKKANDIASKAAGRTENLREEIRSGFKGPQYGGGSPQTHWLSNLGTVGAAGAEGTNTAERNAFSGWNPAWDSNQRSRMLEELVVFVLSNRHLKDNPAYYHKAEMTRFRYLGNDARVNASAGFDRENKQPYVRLFDGYLNFILAVEVAIMAGGKDLFTSLGTMLHRNKFHFSTEMLQDYLDKHMGKNSISFEKAMKAYFWTVAHELGHVCYDHILGPGYDDQPLDVSRNQERDADSFADSMMGSTIFKDSLFEAHLKSCIGWSVVEKMGGRVEPGTHPLSIERLRNTIRNNSEVAKQMGLSEIWVDEIFG